MPSFEKMFDSTKLKIYKNFSENTAGLCIFAGVLSWWLSCFAQVGAILCNEKLSVWHVSKPAYLPSQIRFRIHLAHSILLDTQFCQLRWLFTYPLCANHLFGYFSVSWRSFLPKEIRVPAQLPANGNKNVNKPFFVLLSSFLCGYGILFSDER